MEDKSTLAVAIAADTLGVINQRSLFQALHRRHNAVALLILGVTPETDPSLLNAWSGGAVIACRRLKGPARIQYRIGHLPAVTQQLTGFQTYLRGEDAAYLHLSSHGGARPVASLVDGRNVFPVFVRTTTQNADVFIDCTAVASQEAAEWNVLAATTPVLMFTRFSAGARGWHSIHHYANLTIDDPWLREPYGFLDYNRLLSEMNTHHFHTTIAFIPWNYDRSDPRVASLIRNHPESFSISIHGNNHDHKEFTDYRSKPLRLQLRDLQQSLVRMKRFRELTDVPYDTVMIFPHSIAPEKTLAALKSNNYLATVNSSNVPMDAIRPPGIAFDLHATTLSYADFPSIRRYSVEGPLPDGLIAMNVFLDDPLLFYCHQGFFASGIGAFDSEADYVNRLQPDTRWTSLGDIVRHLYRVKLRDDGNYDVISYSSDITLEDPSPNSALFYVRKRESERPASVTVDGISWPYSLRNGYLEMQVPVEPGKPRTTSIKYRTTPMQNAIGIDKGSFRVYLLRRASDFRDITLSRFALGREFTRLYDEHGGPLTLLLACALVTMAFGAFVAWRLWLMLKGREVNAHTVRC